MEHTIKLPSANGSGDGKRIYKNTNNFYHEMQSGGATYRKFRSKLLIKQNYQCIYCLVDLKDKVANLEHILPVKRGGTNMPNNLAMACPDCNQRKGNSVMKKWKKLAVANQKIIDKQLKAIAKKMNDENYERNRYQERLAESLSWITDQE